MSLHVIAAIVATVVTVLYAVRTGVALRNETRRGLVVARFGIGLVLVSVAAGFLTRAIRGDAFLPVHYFVLGAFLIAGFGYLTRR